MAFAVIPNETRADTAVIWVAAINESLNPGATLLEFGQNQLPLNAGWSNFVTADGKNRIQFQRVTLNNLTARTVYNLTLRIGGVPQANGTLTTLPNRLPVTGDRPFTVLLGSCYFGREDKVGALGYTYMHLPADAKPDIKILCGDQVYLDNPFKDFLNPFHGQDWLESRSFNMYADTWTQSTPLGGFGRMLSINANFFSSDDHEFWNNAPDRGLNVIFYTATQGARDAWWAMARQFYQIFQTARVSPAQFSLKPSRHPPIQFKVSPLSFCVADTRFNRESNPGNLMLPQDLQAIGGWIDNLDGPGILVIGQPFFDGPGGIKDWHLPDFPQYQQLSQMLRRSRHSIVILTGDVHFARMSVADLRPELGTKLYELISSPTQLVPLGGGKYDAAPQVFGSVVSQPEFSLGRHHFLTLEFTAPSAQRAAMRVRFWPIVKDGMPLQPQVIGGGPIELI